jgi:hypothetical protein
MDVAFVINIRPVLQKAWNIEGQELLPNEDSFGKLISLLCESTLLKSGGNFLETFG